MDDVVTQAGIAGLTDFAAHVIQCGPPKISFEEEPFLEVCCILMGAIVVGFMNDRSPLAIVTWVLFPENTLTKEAG